MKNNSTPQVKNIKTYSQVGCRRPPFIPQHMCCCFLCHNYKRLVPCSTNHMLPIRSLPQEKQYRLKIRSEYTQEFVRVGDYKYLYATNIGEDRSDKFELIIDGNYVKIKEYERDFIRIDEKNSLVVDENEFRAAVFQLYTTAVGGGYVFRATNENFVKVADKILILVAEAKQVDSKTVFKFKSY